MKRNGSPGLLLLAIVTAIVLLLVARNWKAAAPRLSETLRARPEAAVAADEPGSPAGAADPAVDGPGPPRSLPGVGEMKRATDRHAGQVQEALAESP
ncbi:MAG: hypothetical protein MUF27_15770 [Acidobacteria bacterium]|jgi:hypothetical protein|nr:hypothetical protein [Acidobacteriota bacterium]